MPKASPNNEIDPELLTARAQLSDKTAEANRLLRLVNRIKGNVTNLEIEIVTRDQQIEELQAQLVDMEERLAKATNKENEQ